jgi:hypothetical protein
MDLIEGGGVATEGLGAASVFGRPMRFGSPFGGHGQQPALLVLAEPASFGQCKPTVIAAPANRTARVSRATEEARVLSHPDVIAAIESALPDLEAWEGTL